MSSEKPFEVTPQHLAGQRVLMAIRDRANLCQQATTYKDFGQDPVLGKTRFVKFLAPQPQLPDGSVPPPIPTFITPMEALHFLRQDLHRNAFNLWSAVNDYAVRRTPLTLPAEEFPTEEPPVEEVSQVESPEGTVPPESALPDQEPQGAVEMECCAPEAISSTGAGDVGGTDVVDPEPASQV